MDENLKVVLSDDFIGGSFHGHTINKSIARLTELIGAPQMNSNEGDDKVNVEWTCVLEDEEGEHVTNFYIYDWKEYRRLSQTENIVFHVGGQNTIDSLNGMLAIRNLLSK